MNTEFSQAQNLAERHQLEISTLQHDAANTSAKAEKELRARNKKIQYLEKKVFSLDPGTMFMILTDSRWRRFGMNGRQRLANLAKPKNILVA